MTDEEFVEAWIRESRPEVVYAVALAHALAAWERPSVEQMLSACSQAGAHPFEVVPWAGYAPSPGRSIDPLDPRGYVDMTAPGAVGRTPQSRSGQFGLASWLTSTRARVRAVEVH